MSKILAVILAVVMLLSAFPLSAMAAWTYDESATTDDYYKLISQKYWQLAPGVQETEVVINNAQATRRQVVHSVKVDMNNQYNNILPGYKGMVPKAGSYGTQTVSQQALAAEKLGYGNVVAATNATLSWYTEAYYVQHPELVGEPLAYAILNGEKYQNSNGPTYGMSKNGTDGILVINYDEHPITGEKRPDSIPKVTMRRLSDPLTGWEQNAIPAWQWLVKPDANGKPEITYSLNSQLKKNDHGSGIASRTFVGVTAEGEVVVAVSDGDQAPFSTGFTMYEMADYMIKMGCVYACNQDGGGSTTFCTQRPGEDLKVTCSLSDGGERPVTSTIMVVSNAPADGELANATISSDYDYYTPGSTVPLSVIGTDGSGAEVDIPGDVQWTVAESNMGSVNNGVFTSNGTEGTATIQLSYNDKVIGERQIHIATPDAISLSQPVVTVPYGKTVKIPVKATVNNGLHEIGLGENDVSFVTDNAAIGSFNGLSFTAVGEADAPDNITSNVTATLNMGNKPTVNFQLNLGRASDVIFDFEGGQADIDNWNIINNRKGTVWDYDMSLSLADSSNGEVHDGDYSMRMQLNGLSSKASHSAEYGWIRLGVDDLVELENARSVGFWLYIPEDCAHLWVCGNYMADTNDDGVYDSYGNPALPPAFPNQVYESIDESGWHYLEFDVSQFKNIALKDERQFPCDGTNKDFFLQFIFARAKQQPIIQYGTAMGPFTFYFDNFTVDYSDAVDDRENPVIDKLYMDGEPMAKREVVTTDSGTVNFTANVADATVRVDANKVEHPLVNISGIDASTAKAYVDGVEVPASYSNGVMSAGNIKVADGYHRIKFEVCDNEGNKSVMIRVFKVETGSNPAAVQLVPADDTLDKLLFGSVYWMNLTAENIEKIKSVETVIDMNSVNHWQLDNMVLADGFTADYSVNSDSNTAAITFTRSGENDQTGKAVIAQIPVRIIDYDNDIHVAGKTAAQYWASHEFWGQDLKLDVDKGLVTFVEGGTETFSNEEFQVDTEMYASRYALSTDNAEYLQTHGSTHIHNAVAIADKAPTCTQPGYTGRTFCEGCNSVVDWGTTVPATGHNYGVVGNKIACLNCGKEITGSGFHTINGKNYYLIGGVLASGWNNVDNEWYYFDENYEGINGKHKFNGIEYNFENGLVEGVWKTDSVGTRYYYGPDYYKHPKRSQLGNFIWVDIKGKRYAFDDHGYRYEGYAVLTTAAAESKLYQFTDEGVLVGEYSPGSDYTGIFVCKKTTTYLKNGVPFAAGLVKEGDDYYYINSGCEAVVGNYDITRPNGLLLPGYYQFAEDGKMINPPVYPDGPNRDGFFYKDGLKLTCYQLAEYNGTYYFISDANKYARNIRLYLSSKYVDKFGLPAGYYDFDNLGKMSVKNGPNEDGYFYLKDVKQGANQLIEFYGNYYYTGDDEKYVVSTTVYLNDDAVAGTDLTAGEYEFDETGKLIIKEEPATEPETQPETQPETEPETQPETEPETQPTSEPEEPAVKNGPNADGYFYLNDVKQKAYQLIKYDGNYYFINDYNKYATSRTIYLSARFVDAYGLAVGYYDFDETGKIVMKNGPYPDGYFYRDGVRLNAYQLVEYEGDYYFVNDSNKFATSRTLYLSDRFVNGTDLKPGYYEFDAEGKVIMKNGPQSDGYFYRNGVRLDAYQLVQYEGSYYFINDSNKFATSRTLYLSDRFVNGTDLKPGYYEFDAEGKVIMKNGPQSDGYFYRDGVRLNAYQLVEYNGDYYFINDSNKYAKSKTIYLPSKFVDPFGLEVGYYEFDADGKIIMKNGPYPDGFFYLNGTRVNGNRLVKYEGDYYYIGVGNKYVKNKWQYVGMPDEVFNGTDVRPWHHSFDDQGRMIGYYKGLPNGRDIGEIYNLKTTDGKSIKSGLLIRGCELDNANYYYPTDIIDEGIDRLNNEFHVKFDMDLRSELKGGLDVFDEDVTHKYYDMVMYEQIFTDEGKAKVKEVFTDLANPDNYPIYMHCTHGIDRTGTVAFLLEAVLGVPRQMLIYEYTLSVGSYGNKIVAVYNTLNSSYSGADFKAKTEAYLKDCGITQEQIDSLREIYLEN